MLDMWLVVKMTFKLTSSVLQKDIWNCFVPPLNVWVILGFWITHRTSWARPSAHWGRSSARLAVAWRNPWGKRLFQSPTAKEKNRLSLWAVLNSDWFPFRQPQIEKSAPRSDFTRQSFFSLLYSPFTQCWSENQASVNPPSQKKKKNLNC